MTPRKIHEDFFEEINGTTSLHLLFNLIINENRDKQLDLSEQVRSSPELDFYDIRKIEQEQEGAKIYIDAIGK